MSELTHLLDAAAEGDRQAAADLLPLVYHELRQLASVRMAAEPAGHTLDATALVHEAYLRLVGPADAARWQHRGHFFVAAAEAMRRILVDHARRKKSDKRGGGRANISLDDIDPAMDAPEKLLALDEALTRLAAEEPEAAKCVNLRYFGALTIEESAAALGISVRTANRHFAYAKAWLFQALNGSD